MTISFIFLKCWRNRISAIKKGLAMLLITIVIGLPLFLGLAAAGALVESIKPDELSSMGVVQES
jgi:hypothetical protein